MEIDYKLGLLVIAAYLLGSVPFGLLITKAKGIDLRKVGSGNIGATNVGRAIGKKWAYICFFLDAFKGAAPMIAAFMIIERPPSTMDLWLWLLAGAAAIAGHIYPIYVHFKGGKGVATSLGMVLGLWPYYTLSGVICFCLWAVIFFKWRYVSLASIVAAMSFPVVFALMVPANDWRFAELFPLLLASVVMSALVVFKHRENIKRLKAGTEHKHNREKTDKNG